MFLKTGIFVLLIRYLEYTDSRFYLPFQIDMKAEVRGSGSMGRELNDLKQGISAFAISDYHTFDTRT